MNRAEINIRVPKSVHVPLLVAGFAALLFAAVGVTTAPLSEWLASNRGGAPSADQQKDAEDSPATSPVSESRAKERCKHCGIIESTRKVGAIHEVTVRLSDRSTRVFSDSNPSSWRPGERIILIGGGNSPSH